MSTPTHPLIPPSSTFGRHLTRFFTHYLAREKGLSPNTIASYATALKLFLQFCCERLQVSSDKLDPRSLTHELILQFLDHLEDERGNSANTRNQRLAVIKSFFRFLALQDPLLSEQTDRICAIQRKAIQDKVIDPLTQDQVQAMIDATTPDTVWGARDLALLLVFHNTGARVQELVDLPVTAVRLEAPTQVLLTGKGRKERVVPLWDNTVKALEHYLALRGREGIDHERLFLNTRRAPLTRWGMSHIVEKYRRLAASACPSLATHRVTPHTFRHTTALHLIQSDAGLPTVQEWLGHAQMKTTHQYTTINIDMKREVLEHWPPPQVQSPDQPSEPEWLDPDTLRLLDHLAGKHTLCEALPAANGHTPAD